jgi:hypothetical protein
VTFWGSRAVNKPDEAIEAFEIQIEKTPLRAQTLLGLARAAGDAGDVEVQADAYRRLASIWHSADRSAPRYDEVMRSAKGGD